MSIKVKNLRHVYHQGTPLETVALEGVSLSVEGGKWVAVVGHTGSGKSTLAQHLNALLLPQEGEISVDGEPVKKGAPGLRDIRRKVGLVFQYPEQQLFAENILEEVAFGPRNWGISEEEIPERVRAALKDVGLEDLDLERSPFSLSGGQKRRLAIASVLASRPSYLVLDEPTAGLDSLGRRDLLNLLKSLKEQGIGIVQVTHDLEIALSVCDRICVLERGKALFWGTPEIVVEQMLDRPIEGLILPDVLQVAKEMRDRGIDVPLTWDPERLADAVLKEI